MLRHRAESESTGGIGASGLGAVMLAEGESGLCYPNSLTSDCKSKPSHTLSSAEFGSCRRFLIRQGCLHFPGHGPLLVFRKGPNAGGQAGMQSL